MTKAEAESEVETTMAMVMTLTNVGRREVGVDQQGHLWLVKSHASKAQLTPS